MKYLIGTFLFFTVSFAWGQKIQEEPFFQVVAADNVKGTDIVPEAYSTSVSLSVIGSVTNYHIHSVDNQSFPSKNVFIKKK